MFEVGQKVVCIAHRIGVCGCGPRYEPDKGDIATVSNIFISWCGERCIELNEFPALPCSHAGLGWLAEDFRPIVERKTSIEIFTKMLTPKKVDA